MLADPDRLRETARSIRLIRDAVADDRRMLQAQVGAFATWNSPASDQFYEQRFVTRLHIYDERIHDLEALAASLDEGAARLDEQRARVAALQRDIETWFAHNRPSDGSTPRWDSELWRYRPGRLPPTGDSEWLSAAKYLRFL